MSSPASAEGRSAVDTTPRTRVLLVLARRYRIAQLKQARGRCFSTSLAFALEARRRGIDVDLLRWRVKDSEDFADHWAIRLDAERALDLSSVQFDPLGRPVQSLDAYPDNFTDRREYPASLFLDAYQKVAQHRRNRFPLAFLMQVCRAMWRHDVVADLKRGALHKVVQGSVHVLGRLAALRLEWLRRRLDRRARQLRGESPSGNETVL